MKKNILWIILSVFMWLMGIKGIVSVITDTDTAHYNNLPMFIVYILLLTYLLLTCFISIKTLKKCKTK